MLVDQPDLWLVFSVQACNLHLHGVHTVHYSHISRTRYKSVKPANGITFDS